MLALRDLQTALRRALLEEDFDSSYALGAEIADGDFSARERLAVYRNNIFASLTDALRETFPVICRLVDERFFSYAAHEFIASHPPKRPSLTEYGGAFPDFLASFPPCGELSYLADVARFEWLMNVAAHATEAKTVSADCLAGVDPQDAVRLAFTLHPSYGYLSSHWPVDHIWRANSPGPCNDAVIDLASGGVHLEVSRKDGDVIFRALDDSAFSFRQALAMGACFGEAIERTLARDPDFDPGAALAALFAEGAISAVILSPPATELSS
jgi:hypothetical protein